MERSEGGIAAEEDEQLAARISYFGLVVQWIYHRT
jgi:hypothetical protein